MLEIKPFGKSALIINFDQEIDERILKQVVSLNKHLNDQLSGIVDYTIPAYASIVLRYHHRRITFKTLKRKIIEINDAKSMDDTGSQRKIEIPVCYDPSLGIDMKAISKQLSLSISEIIALHSNQKYMVFAVGFLPGFAYLGKLPSELRMKRKSKITTRVPKGSVAIAGEQTGIYPSESPGGWHIIGRTPIQKFIDIDNGSSLLATGDQVTFSPISLEEFNNFDVP